jgi:hypothetical protein
VHLTFSRRTEQPPLPRCRAYSDADEWVLARISHRICRAFPGPGGRRQITNGIGDEEVPALGKQSVLRPCRPGSIGFLSLLGQTS